MTDIRIKRACRAARVSDGNRTLVDRLWPRSMAKDRIRVSAWRKDLAPSDALRRWFGCLQRATSPASASCSASGRSRSDSRPKAARKLSVVMNV